MVKLTKRDKEKIQQVQEIEAQLRASANAASQVVGSWLGDSDNDDDEGTKDAKEGAVQQSKVAVKARDVFQGRPARLGVGAKFLSHKDMVEGNRGGDHVVSLGPGVLTSEELRLKRRLTKGAGARKDEDGPGGTKRTAQQANKDDEDEGDSKSKVFTKQSKSMSTVDSDQSKPKKAYQKESSHSEASQPFKKKQKRTAILLDSLIQRRKR
ncbi:hypothetical protein IW140_001298 [Coemansia sp. RSA 1813]|nr:hypothetical protein EV178_001114 [Coemansia sp. RSA 1646]KAJ2091654.1 hypothetical protein IW138_001636 [Coemansia sp. RSA 986]KAJ2571948.1 hypothetical protein IW140_001298 [Coemansia sp. RSA 1813]